MCRWLAYSGAPICLEDVLFNQQHSLIDQSLKATASETPTNGDGFGIGWYGKRDFPGVYKDIRPAWNDSNLRDIAAQIESPLFLAHVRATTGTEVQRSNCHPFRHQNWLFVHNGLVNDFARIKRDLVLAIAPEFFPCITGTTDTEILFYLALTFGMTEDVEAGLSRMAGFVEHTAAEHGVADALQMTLGISDGQSTYACRYSTQGRSRSLFHSASIDAIREIAPQAGRYSADTRAIVSEPLNELEGAWIAVPESSFITVNGGEVYRRDFQPRRH